MCGNNLLYSKYIRNLLRHISYYYVLRIEGCIFNRIFSTIFDQKLLYIYIQIDIYEHTYWLRLWSNKNIYYLCFLVYGIIYFSINRNSVDWEIYRIEFISEFIVRLFGLTESNIRILFIRTLFNINWFMG